MYIRRIVKNNSAGIASSTGSDSNSSDSSMSSENSDSSSSSDSSDDDDNDSSVNKFHMLSNHSKKVGRILYYDCLSYTISF